MSSLVPVIVVFKKTTSPAEVAAYAQRIEDNGGVVTHRYGSVLNGFAARIPPEQLQSFQTDMNNFDSPIDYIERADSQYKIQIV